VSATLVVTARLVVNGEVVAVEVITSVVVLVVALGEAAVVNSFVEDCVSVLVVSCVDVIAGEAVDD
jgi:hypothetical protein